MPRYFGRGDLYGRSRCASILLFNGSGVMSFEARRGLSERYLVAVKGHSPWTPECRDALYPGCQALTLTAPILRASWALTVVRLTETGVTSPPAHYC
jgi:hypothetical protein